MRRSPRLVDVARKAGVHVSTVSRVLNERQEAAVRPATRQRILDAATSLHYRPNALARGLKTNATTTFGMLVPSLRNPVYSAIVRGAVGEAWSRGYVVVLAEDDDLVAEQTWERLAESGRIDGILIASAAPGSPILQLAAGGRVPYVFLNRRVPGTGRNVSMREEDAGRIAADHLIGLGHLRLAQIAGPLSLDTARRRADGFAGEVRLRGLARPSLVETAFDEAGAFAAMASLLAGREPPTGVFISNLNQAIGALACARRRGVEIPGELSLVSYDDDPLAEYLEVALTTVRMPLAELGRAGITALAQQIAGEEPADVELQIAPELIVRASTGPRPLVKGAG